MATVGYVGFFPWAQATLASALMVPVYFFLPPLSNVGQALLLVAVTWIGVIASTMAEAELGHDAHPIVIDEIAGMIVTLLWIPLPEGVLPRLLVIGAGFVLFRIFDIFKPWPADRLQNLDRGLGVMADDLMAGVYANAALRLALALGFLKWIG